MAKPVGLVYLLFLVSLVTDLFFANVQGSLSKIPMLSPYLGGLVLFFLYRGKPEFLFDSDGEVLNFTAQDPSLTFLGKASSVTHTEFPKRKLLKYNIKKLPFKKTLVIYIQSKKGFSKKQFLGISYLSASHQKSLTNELDLVLAKNDAK